MVGILQGAACKVTRERQQCTNDDGYACQGCTEDSNYFTSPCILTERLISLPESDDAKQHESRHEVFCIAHGYPEKSQEAEKSQQGRSDQAGDDPVEEILLGILA